MELFIQQLASGIGIGAIYASLALALVFIFRSTGVINFAQGEMAMFSAFLAWQFTTWGLPLLVAALVAIAVSFVAGVIIQVVTIRPVQEKDQLSVVAVTVGLFILINALAGFIWSYHTKAVASPFPDSLAVGPVNGQIVGTLVVSLIVVVVFALVLKKTKLGLAMRAAAQVPASSRLVGVRVWVILALGWGFAAALGAVSGILIAPQVMLEPNMMALVMVYAFASAALGGLDSLIGAIVGGLLVGVSETLAGSYIPFIGSDLKVLVPLAIIFLVLLVKPEGLFGRKRIERV